MQIPGASIVSSIAGAAEAKTREAAAKLRAKRHEPDPEIDKPYGHDAVAETELSQAAREAAGNDQEEAHEDREEHKGQSARQNAGPKGPQRPRLDLEG